MVRPAPDPATTPRAQESSVSTARVIPGKYTPRFVSVFGWYVERRLLPKKFHAALAARGSGQALEGVDNFEGPVLVVMNHAAWWDPLVCLLVQRRWMPSRTSCAPMEADQLVKFGFFKKLGLFGIDPDDPASLEAMGRYVALRFTSDRRPTLWITPQGRFADVRDPIEIRPGAAAIAARTPGLRVLSLAVEYGFWVDPRPELFLRVVEVPAPPGPASTASWHRAVLAGMRANQSALAALVRSRDPGGFEAIVGGPRAGGTNPFYDLWLKIRGKKATIESDRLARSEAVGRG
jgi:1-acyl-sn-glycerol-3-phosphate acyltransferase